MREKIEPEIRGYLLRRHEAAQEVIDNVRVFSKKYNDAVDDLEEIEDLLRWKGAPSRIGV